MGGFGRAEDSKRFIGICAEHTGVIPAERCTQLISGNDQPRGVAILQQKALALDGEVAQRRKVKEELRRSHLELQQTSSALHESEARYRFLVHSLPGAVFFFDRAPGIPNSNHRAVPLS